MAPRGSFTPARSDLPLDDRTRAAADLIMRVWCKSPGPHWHEDAAVLVLSSGEIRDEHTAIEKLKARHVKRVWGGKVVSLSFTGRVVRDDRVTVCTACNVAWPCPDAEILGVA